MNSGEQPNRSRIVATKTLRGFEYHFEVAKGSSKWKHTSADLICSEMRAEGFLKHEIEKQFTDALTICRGESTLASEFIAEIAFGLKRRTKNA